MWVWDVPDNTWPTWKKHGNTFGNNTFSHDQRYYITLCPTSANQPMQMTVTLPLLIKSLFRFIVSTLAAQTDDSLMTFHSYVFCIELCSCVVQFTNTKLHVVSKFIRSMSHRGTCTELEMRLLESQSVDAWKSIKSINQSILDRTFARYLTKKATRGQNNVQHSSSSRLHTPPEQKLILLICSDCVYFIISPWCWCFYNVWGYVVKWKMIQSLHGVFYFDRWPDFLRCSSAWLPA